MKHYNNSFEVNAKTGYSISFTFVYQDLFKYYETRLVLGHGIVIDADFLDTNYYV